jgi:hypothetical protein
MKMRSVRSPDFLYLPVILYKFRFIIYTVPKKDEVIGDWRKLHNEGLHNLYSSPNIISQNKSRGMKCAG